MNSRTLAMSALAITTLLLLLPAPSSAITCSDVVKDLSPCIKYLVNGGSPSTACCAGAANLANSAATSADKKTACTCILSTAQKVTVNAAAAQALPGSCGITLPFTVSLCQMNRSTSAPEKIFYITNFGGNMGIAVSVFAELQATGSQSCHQSLE